jgi:hypothetical protein
MKAKISILIVLICIVAPATHATRPNLLPTGVDLYHLIGQAFGISTRYSMLDDSRDEPAIQQVEDHFADRTDILAGFSALADIDFTSTEIETEDDLILDDYYYRPYYRTGTAYLLGDVDTSRIISRLEADEDVVGTLEFEESPGNVVAAEELLSLDLQDRLCLKRELEFRPPEILFNEKAGHFAAMVNTYEDHDLRRGYAVQAGVHFSEMDDDFSCRVGLEYRRGLPEIGDFTPYESDFVGLGFWIDF